MTRNTGGRGRGYDTVALRAEDVSDEEVAELLESVESIEADIGVTIARYQQGGDVDDRLDRLFDEAREKLDRVQGIYGQQESISMEEAYETVESETDSEPDDFVELEDLALADMPEDEYIEGSGPMPVGDDDFEINRAAEKLEYTLKGAEMVRELY